MLTYFLYKAGEFIALALPWGAAYRLGKALAELHFYLSKKDRVAVFNNLKAILPNESEEKLWVKTKEVFRNFGIYLVEFFRSSKIDQAYVKKFIKIEGLEFVNDSLKDSGGIFLTAHIGNWELGGMVLSMLGYSSIAIALTHPYHKVNSFFTKKREEKGIEVVHLGFAVKRCFQGLKEKKLVAILGERDFGGSGYRMEFLGMTKMIPRGPAVLAKKAGVPIIPAFAIRENLNYMRIKIFPPIYVKEKDEEKETIKSYIKIIEQQILENPTQWLMFREFWKE